MKLLTTFLALSVFFTSVAFAEVRPRTHTLKCVVGRGPSMVMAAARARALELGVKAFFKVKREPVENIKEEIDETTLSAIGINLNVNGRGELVSSGRPALRRRCTAEYTLFGITRDQDNKRVTTELATFTVEGTYL